MLLKNLLDLARKSPCYTIMYLAVVLCSGKIMSSIATYRYVFDPQSASDSISMACGIWLASNIVRTITGHGVRIATNLLEITVNNELLSVVLDSNNFVLVNDYKTITRDVNNILKSVAMIGSDTIALVCIFASIFKIDYVTGTYAVILFVITMMCVGYIIGIIQKSTSSVYAGMRRNSTYAVKLAEVIEKRDCIAQFNCRDHMQVHVTKKYISHVFAENKSELTLCMLSICSGLLISIVIFIMYIVFYLNDTIDKRTYGYCVAMSQSGLAIIRRISTISNSKTSYDTIIARLLPARRKRYLILEQITSISVAGFTINRGLNCLMGKSGIGKTTIAKSIAGETSDYIYPVTFNNTFCASDYYVPVGVVPQQAELFDATIFDNVHIANLNATAEMVSDAMSNAGFDDGMYDYLHKSVGRNGMHLSGGQKQRVSIARVLLQDASVIILDEPTSALDHETSIRIMETFHALSKDRIVILITHDPFFQTFCENNYTFARD